MNVSAKEAMRLQPSPEELEAHAEKWRLERERLNQISFTDEERLHFAALRDLDDKTREQTLKISRFKSPYPSVPLRNDRDADILHSQLKTSITVEKDKQSIEVKLWGGGGYKMSDAEEDRLRERHEAFKKWHNEYCELHPLPPIMSWRDSWDPSSEYSKCTAAYSLAAQEWKGTTGALSAP